MKIFTLGGLKISRAGEPAPHLGSRKSEALIVYLVSTQRPQAREVLADLLWDDRSQSQALSNLRAVLTLLRKHFDPYFVITRETVALDPEAKIWFDVAKFEGSLKSVRRAGRVHAADPAERVRAAVQLYQGEFLKGFYIREGQGFDAWMVQERERLHHLALSALSDLVDYYLEHGDYQQGIAHATRLLELDPLMESAHRQMIQLLALSNKRALALKQFETLQQTLAQELAIEPEAESRQLYEDIRAGLICADVPQPVASPPKATRPRHNLPASLTPFIGRDCDVNEVAALMQDPAFRLVTLVGPGGIGKTRLALRAAEDLLPAFEHGAWFVALDSFDSPDFLAEAVTAALGLPLSGQVAPDEQLLESLRGKDVLLLLDNFEHLLPGGTGLLIEILHQAPGVKLLVTSREKLNLQAECLYEVRGLDFPKDGQDEILEVYPAATLFLQCAQRAAGIALPDEDSLHVSRITRLVEGSPLALELAAAWTRALSCREIAAEIERGLGFLQSNQPDVPERHRSMRAVFDHSWRLLSQEEKSVFRRLSVFRGGFDRQSAREVAGASLETLAALVDKSLVYHQTGGRYHIHELLRQFAAGELEEAGKTAATREQHLAYFLQLAEQAEPHLWREQEIVWLDRLETEIGNLRKALAWSLSPQSALGVHAGMRIVLAIEQFLWVRGYFSEAAGWLADLLAHPLAEDHPKIFANGLRLAAWVSYWAFGKFEEAREYFERGLAIAEAEGDPLILAHILSDFGNFNNDIYGNLTVAESYLERSLALYREIGYEPGIGTVLRRVGHLFAYCKFDHHLARSYYQESLQVWKALGNSSGIAQGLFELGRNHVNTGLFAEARVFLEEGLKLFQELNNNFVDPTVLAALGFLEFATGDIAQAVAYFEEILSVSRDFGMKKTIPESLLFLGEIARYQEDYTKALSYYQEALAISEELGYKEAQVWALLGQGFIFLRQEDRVHALELLKESLLLSREFNKTPYSGVALFGLAGLSAASKQTERAARLWGAAVGTLESTSAALANNPADFAEYKRINVLVREQLDDATFNQLVQEGRAMAAEGIDHVIAYAFDES